MVDVVCFCRECHLWACARELTNINCTDKRLVYHTAENKFKNEEQQSLLVSHDDFADHIFHDTATVLHYRAIPRSPHTTIEETTTMAYRTPRIFC